MITKNDILETISTQKDRLLSMESFPRELLGKFHLPYPNFAYVVTGIRRCGKSTLVGQLMKSRQDESLFVKFDTPKLFDFQMSDFRLLDAIITDQHPQNLFFDEIQVVKGWEAYVLGKLDEGYNVVVTGSNASMLSRELGTRLTGRHIPKTLYPFSYREYTGFAGVEAGIDSFRDYMRDGGFPGYLKQRDDELLSQLTEDILYRDILVRYNIKDSLPLKRLTTYLASNCGKLMSANNLKDVIAVKSAQSVVSYLSYLSDAFLFNYVSRFSYSYKTQQRNPKKVYCIDTGLQSQLTTSFSKDEGRRLENLVYLELLRRGGEIYYFNEENKECDFVVCQKSTPVSAIQVCQEVNPENEDREVNGLLFALDYFNFDEGIIITENQDDELFLQNRHIRLVPAWKWCMGANDGQGRNRLAESAPKFNHR